MGDARDELRLALEALCSTLDDSEWEIENLEVVGDGKE